MRKNINDLEVIASWLCNKSITGEFEINGSEEFLLTDEVILPQRGNNDRSNGK